MKWNSSMGYSNPISSMGHLSRSHPQYCEIVRENNNQKVHSPEELGVASAAGKFFSDEKEFLEMEACV
jgi:hypothetical protein